MRKVFIFFIVIQFVWQNSFAQKITVDSLQIKKHIQYLASDELSGRYPGTEGEQKAAGYIQSQFKSAGCKMLFNGGFQEFSTEMKTKNTPEGKILLKGKNVVAMVEGKKNANEYIVIGAHYDHLGMGGYGSGSRKPDTAAVHNGADDNASGVAVLIECAKAIAKQKPERSIIFVAFSAEEEGLVGSRYFIENSPVPKEKIKAMVNFDMVGRLDSVLTIEGTGTALQFDSLLSTVNAKSSFQIRRLPGGFGPSDQTSFYTEKIPVLFFHTTIEHEQYHTPFDDWELINAKGAAEIADYAAQVILRMARENQNFTYQVAGKPLEMTRGVMKVTLGVMPDHAANVKGLRIAGVRPGQAADKAGLLKNDVIIEIQGEAVEDIESYMRSMGKCDKGQTVPIVILRNNEKQTVMVTF